MAPPNDQPRYFTLIDLFRELFHLGFIAAGCYAGWKLGGSFLALYAGGICGRVAGVAFVVGLLSLTGSGQDD